MEYEAPLTDVPPLADEYSLEEILAEYGNSREQKIMEDVEQAVKQAEPSAEMPLPQQAQEPPRSRKVVPFRAKAQTKAAPETATETGPEPEGPPEPELPIPRPITLEEVVGSTVDAVMEESAEPILKPRRSLFSRRPPEETEQLYETGPKSTPQPEAEAIGLEPDLSEAAVDHRDKYRAGKSGLIAALLTGLLPTVPLAAEQYGAVIPMWTGDIRFQSIVLLACLAMTALLCRQVVVKAVSMLCRKRCVSELLVTAAVLAAMADCAMCLLSAERTQVPPYGAAACLALVFAQWGITMESRGLYDTFRTAAMDDEPPYLVTDTEQGACKQRGTVAGFYTAAMQDNASTLWQTVLMPVVFVATIVFACLSSLGQDRGEDFLLNWSAILAAGATLTLPLCWGLPYARLARHLQKIGCAAAGWSGAEKISRRKCMIVTDADLFPPGTVMLNGIKIYGEERRKVISYAATLARCAGSGLERLFDGLLRGEMGRYETAQDFSFYEEGGYSAVIRGESVLLGTASFMRKMDVRLPKDIKLKTGIFLAADRQLLAVFAVKYHPAENVDYALRLMRRSKILPILAARDPNITPALLKRKFHKNVRVDYPDLTTRVALSEAGSDRDLPRALLFREGLLPYAEAVVGSRRMCQAVRKATLLGLLGSVVGTLLAFYMVFQSAYDLLTPLLLEVFLLLWALPVLLIVNWSKRA